MGQNQSSGNLEDKYFLQKVKLGQGSFGTVWRAVDRQNDRVVAIKQLDKAQLPKRGVKRQDIEREIAMMKAASHENLTQLFDTYEDQNCIYLALEYCDGGDFGDKVKERGMQILEKEVAEFMRQICAAMNALHTKQICHRDIKPDNFMVQTDPDFGNKLKLTDFGLAIFVPTGKLLMEKCGTPAFMAPEQHRLPRESRGYSFPADVWAAGVSMYMVMFGGRHPFMNDRGLDDRLLLTGQLDFRENQGQKFFGFDMGIGSLRFSDSARQLCQRMVCPDERQRMTADDALRTPWLVQLGNPAGRPPGVAPKQASQLGPTGGAFPAAGEAARPVGSELRLRNENEDLKNKLAQQEAQMQELQRMSVLPSSHPQQGYPQQAQQALVQQQALQDGQRALLRQQTRQIEAGPRHSPERGPAAGRVGAPPQQPPGTLLPGAKCRYYSATYGWMPAFVLGMTEADSTYDLDVRPHAPLDKISPLADTSRAEAWPPNTLVQYHSVSVNKWLPATVVRFNEEDGTYNLDVRDHADVDKIRARLPGSAELRDGSASAPLMLKDLAAGVESAKGGLVRSPEMSADPQQRIHKNDANDSGARPANSSGVDVSPVFLSEGMFSFVVDVGPGEVVAVRDGVYDIKTPNRGLLRDVLPDQLRAPMEPHQHWPPGMKVSYRSSTTGSWIPGTVHTYHPRDRKYDLDVRQHADPERIRPR